MKKRTTVDIGQKVSEKRAGEQYGTKKNTITGYDC